MLIGESNVAIDPAIGGYGAADIYLGEFSPQRDIRLEFRPAPRAGPEGPWPPGPKALGLDVSVLCQD